MSLFVIAAMAMIYAGIDWGFGHLLYAYIVAYSLMTLHGFVLFFYYLFDSLGLNFGNSDKAAWIRLLHNVTGRNADNIKQRLNFKFDEEQTQKDLRYVAGCLKELFPSISSKIERDSRIQ